MELDGDLDRQVMAGNCGSRPATLEDQKQDTKSKGPVLGVVEWHILGGDFQHCRWRTCLIVSGGFRALLVVELVHGMQSGTEVNQFTACPIS